ncbi:hypothetical protein [Candidatus Thioglobus sp.]|jgi:hypothetical protein|uniref:hypothetical protein n=1 Tax=Candidatus Thioglobus sp. TaxID=2026721 RepID=UPI001760C4CA|nr:hypothetical protein [Candidatus Thioglobus sp.]HIF47153.1 hypothetical protein [Candidatus Thioglobus sp.]
MKNLNLKLAIASLLTSGVLFTNTASALEGLTSNTADGTAEINISENDEITLSFNHPQSLAVSSPNNVANRASSGVINRTWHVVSNNAVTVKFTGRSPDAAGGLTDAPTFYKAELGADGAQIGTQYDHLVTTFGATINNMGADQGTMTGTNNFGQGAVAKDLAVGVDGVTTRIETLENGQDVLLGTPDTLISNGGQGFGVIMPDDNGRFSMTLSSRGVGDVATTQSGDYQITIVASFIANELGNLTIVPTTVETIAASGLLTDTQSYADLAGVDATDADNTAWTADTTDALSYDILGTDQVTDLSAQKISDDADDTTASNAEVYDENTL